MMLKMKQVFLKIGFPYTYVTWASNNYDWNVLRLKAYYWAIRKFIKMIYLFFILGRQLNFFYQCQVL